MSHGIVHSVCGDCVCWNFFCIG